VKIEDLGQFMPMTITVNLSRVNLSKKQKTEYWKAFGALMKSWNEKYLDIWKEQHTKMLADVQELNVKFNVKAKK